MKIIKNTVSEGCCKKNKHPRINELEDTNQKQMTVPSLIFTVHLDG